MAHLSAFFKLFYPFFPSSSPSQQQHPCATPTGPTASHVALWLTSWWGMSHGWSWSGWRQAPGEHRLAPEPMPTRQRQEEAVAGPTACVCCRSVDANCRPHGISWPNSNESVASSAAEGRRHVFKFPSRQSLICLQDTDKIVLETRNARFSGVDSRCLLNNLPINRVWWDLEYTFF
jgi:hypothetical protein